MKTPAPNSTHRCAFIYTDGRRCRTPRRPDHPSFCPTHAKKFDRLTEEEKLRAEFVSLSGNLNTVTDINHVLTKVFNAMAQGRISHRTANTLGYLAQLLLQSMPEVRREVNGAVGNSGAYDALLRQQIPLFQKFRKP
jgi:Fe-S-cluster containining protein